MDAADIPAAAAFLGPAELPSASSESTARRSSAAPSSRPARLHNSASHGGASLTMDPHATAAAAALLGAGFYPSVSSSVAASVADASMTHNYYAAQNLASPFPFMPMYGLNMFPPPPLPFLGGGAMSCMGSMTPSPRPGPSPIYDAYSMDPSKLQNQIAAQFTQSTPEQQTAYYEDIRARLDAAASTLNESQKQTLLNLDPSLSFTMKPLDLDKKPEASALDEIDSTPARAGGSNSMKRGRPLGSGTPSMSSKKKKKKTKASVCESNAAEGGEEQLQGLINEDTPDASSSATTTPRATPRGRPPGTKSTKSKSNLQAGGPYELTPSGKRKSMTPQAEEMRARKAKMTWPKGTFILRLQDVKARNGRDHIWLVDNHQLLQRYNNETGGICADGSRIYHKTDRYTGWLCHEGYHYFPLFDQTHILRSDGDTITVKFPQEEELQQAIDYMEQEKSRRVEAKDVKPFVAQPLPPSLRNEPARLARRLEEQLAAQQQQEQEQRELQLLERPLAHDDEHLEEERVEEDEYEEMEEGELMMDETPSSSWSMSRQARGEGRLTSFSTRRMGRSQKARGVTSSSMAARGQKAGGGGERQMLASTMTTRKRSAQQQVSSSSHSSSSMTMAAAYSPASGGYGTAHSPASGGYGSRASASRSGGSSGRGMHDMPSLCRQEYWDEHHQQLQGGGLQMPPTLTMLGDDVIELDGVHDEKKKVKQEEEEYHEYEGLADLTYSRMLP